MVLFKLSLVCVQKKKKSSPLIIRNRFYNRSNQKIHPFFWRSFYMLVVSRIQRLIAREAYHEWHAPGPVIERSVKPKITWIGHASFLVQIGGCNILLDPLFGAPSILFNRLVPPGVERDMLPPIDAVLISHNHYDHMDSASLKYIKKHHKSRFCVPYGDEQWFHDRKFRQVHAFEWWQQYTIEEQNAVTITFLPAHHWSARSLFDTNKSLWGSWLIEYNGYKIYFAGDTAWDVHFQEIGEQFGAIDVVLLPIGPCEPHKWMKHSHLNAEQAIEAAIALNARHCIPMHWGTFGFGVDSFTLPIDRMRKAWEHKQRDLHDLKLHILKSGSSFSAK